MLKLVFRHIRCKERALSGFHGYGGDVLLSWVKHFPKKGEFISGVETRVRGSSLDQVVDDREQMMVQKRRRREVKVHGESKHNERSVTFS